MCMFFCFWSLGRTNENHAGILIFSIYKRMGELLFGFVEDICFVSPLMF